MSTATTEAQTGRVLAELATTANREHALAVREETRSRTAQAARLEHIFRAGDALIAVRGQLDRGSWRSWLAANFAGSHATAEQYVRMATYQDRIPADAATWGAALASIRGLPAVNGVALAHPPAIKREALRLVEQGAPQTEVAELLGVSAATINCWVNPHRRAQQRRRAWREKRAREALRRIERDRAARKMKGPLAESYALTRRLAQALDQAYEAAEGRESLLAIKAALTKVYAAEDEIARALKLP